MIVLFLILAQQQGNNEKLARNIYILYGEEREWENKYDGGKWAESCVKLNAMQVIIAFVALQINENSP